MSATAYDAVPQIGGAAPSGWDAPAPLARLRSVVSLWWIMTKRNGGLLLLPAVAAVMGWLVRNSHYHPVISWMPTDQGVIPVVDTEALYLPIVLWMPTVQGIGYTLAVAGPLTTSLASWIAGRSRRRGVTDLLDTVPLPGGWSILAEWLGVVFWALLAFLGSAAVALLWTATETTWGGPLLEPIVVAAVALGVCAAAGVLLGSLWPNRFLPPLLAIIVAALIVAPTGVVQLEPVKMLSPMGPIDSMVRESLVQVDTRIVAPHLVWLAALGLTLLLVLVAWQSRGKVASGLLVLSALVAVVSGSRLVGYELEGDSNLAMARALPYEPVCASDVVTVCVHPAYEELHDEAVTAIKTILQPLVGIDGVPIRFEQSVGMEPRSEGVVPIYLYGREGLERDLAAQVPIEVVADWQAMAAHQQGSGGLTAAQAIVAVWLSQEYERRAGIALNPHFAGVDPGASNPLVPLSMVAEGQPFMVCQQEAMLTAQCDWDIAAGKEVQARIDAATERFLALDQTTRRAWLETHWVDLRAGLVTLEEMP